MIKYDNDLELTDLSMQMKNYCAEYNRCIRDGQLKAAFLMAMEVERFARKAQERLNEIRYPKAAA